MSNSILERFMASYDAFERLVFPFADRYLKQIKVPRGLILNDDLDDRAREVIDQIESMIDNLERFKSLRRIDGNSLGDGRFDNSGVSTRPFYVWKNTQKVKDLLSGGPVTLVADIANSGITDKDAIKFKDLGLNFRVTGNNTSRQSQLNELLRAFRLNMVHVGDSYYRYANEVYAMPTKRHGIWYDLDFDAGSNMPKSKSREYEDIRSGDYILSPYGTWELRLDNLTNRVRYEDLMQFKDQVDLELTGNASFVVRDEERGNPKELKLGDYYKSGDGGNFLEDSEKKRIAEAYETAQIRSGRKGLESPGSWFTWKLPNFNIIPGAEAFSTDEIRMLNQPSEEHDYFDEFYRSEEQEPTTYLLESIGYSPLVETRKIDTSSGGNSVLPLDNGHLVLAQLVAGKLFGPNPALSNQSGYESLEEQKNRVVSEISAKVKHSLMNNKLSIFVNADDFIDNYKQSGQWYQTMFENELNEVSYHT